MKIRKHMGGLSDSMKTAKEIDNTLESVRQYAKSQNIGMKFSESELDSFDVEPYGSSDNRIGWNETFVITYSFDEEKSRVVFGFCDQPIVN